MQTGTKQPWNWLLFPFSAVTAGPYGVFAATIWHGVYSIEDESEWDKLGTGLPDTAGIHRLQLHHELLHACTNNGLYEWNGETWVQDGLTLPCYQYRRLGGACYASTSDGLWIRTGSKWGQLSCEGKHVFDFLSLPQYVVVGHDTGISLYDRFMDDWAHFELQRAITSLAVYRGHLIGATDQGELMIGDKKGRFERVQFGKKIIYSIVPKRGVLYVCTDQGLFKLVYIADRLVMLSVQLGFPVTDVDILGDQIYMATMFHGIQTISL
ncbi:hypothetical protein D3P09_11560 [Paenibacillus pinisoli]|uniref:WD40 repeat domain-containing protein n=1 Tax=Paenibacillus pinisoli TaxID=1276110 RepID=A0A3A6PG36_9BACL|nr:hypothetical protein [Paenibacillus pinisoli]RJX40007.1 hypothetical protein D3P09_11560 [Paenibacillus pinisoli]